MSDISPVNFKPETIQAIFKLNWSETTKSMSQNLQ
jgi:hypothetical protein